MECCNHLFRCNRICYCIGMVSVTSASNYVVLVGCPDCVDYTGLKIRESNGICLFYFSTKTYVVGSQKNHLIEMVLLSTQNTFSNRSVRKLLQLYAQKILIWTYFDVRIACIFCFLHTSKMGSNPSPHHVFIFFIIII